LMSRTLRNMTDPLLRRIDDLVIYISDVVQERGQKQPPNQQQDRPDVKGQSVGEHSKYLDTKWQRDRRQQLDILSANGLYFHADCNIDIDAERPIGHSTHNLFLKDKKSKQYFLITHHQSHRMDWKAMAKTLRGKGFRVKELRMDSERNRTLSVRRCFGFDAGCITALSLLNLKDYDRECGVQWIVDSKLVDLSDEITICAGCCDPLDHAQHHVVDIHCAKLMELVQGIGVEPVVVDL